jgi:hypothetical protein
MSLSSIRRTVKSIDHPGNSHSPPSDYKPADPCRRQRARYRCENLLLRLVCACDAGLRWQRTDRSIVCERFSVSHIGGKIDAVDVIRRDDLNLLAVNDDDIWQVRDARGRRVQHQPARRDSQGKGSESTRQS